VFEKLAAVFAKHNIEGEFIVDSFPIYACKLARQNQTKLFKAKEFLGYYSEFLENIRKKKRSMIETLFSCIERLMPRSIHAVTISGIILKTTLFVLAYAFGKYAVPTTEASFETLTESAIRPSGEKLNRYFL